MCGCYRLSRRKQLLEEHFDAGPWDEDWTPRYNIAPTQIVQVVRQNPRKPVRELSLMRWGLIPVGNRSVRRCKNDQREIRDSSNEACLR
jgi:putative SOS response-associated peptidase YedK